MDQKVTFEFEEDFDVVKLEKCIVNKVVAGRVFLCRQGDYGFPMWLQLVPKLKREGRETFGLILRIFNSPGVLSVDIDLFAGNKDTCFVVFNMQFDSSGPGCVVFLPSVASLKERGLLVDGVLKCGIKIKLNSSVFDPFRWLPAPSLTPDTNGVMRHLFANLGTDDHHGTDFIIIAGEGDDKKELHINRLALRRVPSLDWLFNIESKENQKGVLLPWCTADAVIEALRYLYLDKVGVDLTRCLPSLLILASEWDLKPLVTEIERAMVVKLQNNRSNLDLAYDYLQLADYDYCLTKFVTSVAIFILMDNWANFLDSPNGKRMEEELKRTVTCMMSAAAVYKGVSTWMDADPLSSLPASSLTPYTSPVIRQLFANIGTDDHPLTDFIIAVGEGEAKRNLHVLRLALRVVPFFDRMFDNHNWKENQEGVLSLPTHTADVVIEVLRFVYLNEVGEDLSRFLPSLLELASEWELNELMSAIERDMMKKLQADRFHRDYDLAASYLELADRYERKVVGRVATRKLIASWPRFIRSEKARDMEERLKVTCVMAAIASGTPIDDEE